MTAPLVLSEDSTEIFDVCRSIERALAAIPELAGLTLPVELLENFDSLPEAGRSQSVKDTCAAYRRSTKILYVNRNTFCSLPPRAQEAVFAHEIAHALAHRKSLMENLTIYSEFGDFGEEFLADRLACEWGFFEGLRTERISSYGQRYVAALEQWQDESEYLKAMNNWHTLKLAGIT